MTWLKVDDQIFLNRKVAQCDAETKLLYIVGLTYCANQLTDGFIPEATLPLLAGMAGIDWQIAKQSASKLLDVCLWFATDNGWQIPDYLEYNPSKEQVLHNREVRSEAGKRGGQVKASKLPGKTLANAKQNSGKSLPPSPSPSPSPVVESSMSGMKEDSECVNGAPTYPPGFEAFETNFRLNLLNAVKERDPQQMMAGGFSLSDSSKAMLVQVQGSGTLLTASAIEWALDQWEDAKPTEKFRVQDKGCVNWLLTTISNSYQPTRKAGRNGTDPKAPIVTKTVKIDYGDGTFGEREVQARG